MAEAKCLTLLCDSNKPYNVQGVADMLATQGVKKSMAEKALAELALQGKVVCKEFGKTKIYIPRQEGLAALTPDEAATLKEEIKQLELRVQEEEEGVAALKREVATAETQLTMEQLQEQVATLSDKVVSQTAKLDKLCSGATLMSAAEVVKVEKDFSKALSFWTQYRRVFNNVWDAVSENIEGKEADLFAEIGVETDKALGLDINEYRALLQPAKRQRGSVI